MVKLFLNNSTFVETSTTSYIHLIQYVTEATNLPAHSFYLEQNGKRLQCDLDQDSPLYVRLRVLGGKGGFGSMLRAIGAQIEKTTNREACRDLSGRRLRDINEEKRLKAWLDKQGEREREAEERKKRKIEKLLAVPKHEFKDEEYEEARSKLTEKVYDAVEEGFRKSNAGSVDLKRKNGASTSQQAAIKAKKKKAALWIDDDISDDSDDSECDDIVDKKKTKITDVKCGDSDCSSSCEPDGSGTNKQSSTGNTNSSDDESVSTVSK